MCLADSSTGLAPCVRQDWACSTSASRARAVLDVLPPSISPSALEPSAVGGPPLDGARQQLDAWNARTPTTPLTAPWLSTPPYGNPKRRTPSSS